jgi:hypothetical protein
MKRLICVGCGKGEDLNEPTGHIRTMQLVDLTPMYSETGPPDPPIEEDLCGECITKLRRDYFGEPDDGTMEMPLMVVQDGA